MFGSNAINIRNSKYFLNNRELVPEELAKQLHADLTNAVERIHEAVEKKIFQQSQVLLQSTYNSLRHSVECIQLEESQPFFKNDGQRASEWFIALFLNFRKKYPEVPTQVLLKEIAKEFEEGVGIQGAVLQKAYAAANGHQNIINSLSFDLKEHSVWDLGSKDFCVEILNHVLKLEDGVYLLGHSGYKAAESEDTIPGHATAIVIENGDYYFFDINVGLVGTGRHIGTEDKTNDIGAFLLMCKQYSSFDRADALFQKGLKGLSQVIGDKETKLIQKIAPEFGEGRACLNIYAVYGIIEAFKKKGRIFSESEEREIVLALCINPGTLRVQLENSEVIRLNKCIFLG